MLAKAAGHRFFGQVAAGQGHAKAALVQRVLLACLIRPGPFTGLVPITEHRLRRSGVLDLPRMQPALPMQRARVARHVRRQANVAPAKAEGTSADTIDVGHKWEAARVEHLFETAVAFAQYRR